MAVNYDGLTRNRWPGTWSPGGDHPIVLNSEMRGGIHFVEGGTVEELTDIKGQRLVEGMIAYVKTAYTGVDGDTFYIYKSQSGESRNQATGELPNSSANWTKLANTVSSFEELTVDNLFLDGNTISSTDTNGDINITPDGTGKTIITNLYIDDANTTLQEFIEDISGVSFAGGAGITVAYDDAAGTTTISITTDNFTLGTDNVALGDTITDLNGLTSLDVDNITIDGNTISTTDTNGNLLLVPDGTGTIVVPQGYMGRAGIIGDSLVTKAYVDDLSYLNDATAIATPVGITNSDKGITAFDSDQFTVTSGWATITEIDGGSY